MDFLEIILVAFYTALFCFLILRLKFFQRFLQPVKIVAGLFIFKVIVGTLYGFIHFKLYAGGDTYAYVYDSKIVFGALHNNFWLYLKLVFGWSNSNPSPDIVPYKDAMRY